MRLSHLVIVVASFALASCASAPRPAPETPAERASTTPATQHPGEQHVHTATCGHFLGYYRGHPAFEYAGLRSYWDGEAWVRLPETVTEFVPSYETTSTPDGAYARPGPFPLPDAPAPTSAAELREAPTGSPASGEFPSS